MKYLFQASTTRLQSLCRLSLILVGVFIGACGTRASESSPSDEALADNADQQDAAVDSSGADTVKLYPSDAKAVDTAESDVGTCTTPEFHQDPRVCGTCVMTLETFCKGNCDSLDKWECRETYGVVSHKHERGCGYLRASQRGDVGDYWGSVYDEATGKLVYAWNNGRLSMGCSDAIIAGTEPQCDSWKSVTCADLASDGGPGDDADSGPQ